MIYPSFESRSEINALVAERERQGHWPRDPDGVPLYPGRGAQNAARPNANAGAGRTSRSRCGSPWMRPSRAPGADLDRDRQRAAGPDRPSSTAAPQMWGDVVLARKELPTSYHLAVAVDDALQGVTDVVRGQDLFWATGIHRLLQALLGLPEPVYHHHRLILDADGRKLSKSTQATSLRELRAARRERGGYQAHGGARTWLKIRASGLVLFRALPCAVAWWALAAGSCHGAIEGQNKERQKAGARAVSGGARGGGAGRSRRQPTASALAAFAHDIRTALTGILALGELLASSNLGERERRWAVGHQEQRRASRRADHADGRCRQGRRGGADAAAGSRFGRGA